MWHVCIRGATKKGFAAYVLGAYVHIRAAYGMHTWHVCIRATVCIRARYVRVCIRTHTCCTRTHTCLHTYTYVSAYVPRKCTYATRMCTYASANSQTHVLTMANIENTQGCDFSQKAGGPNAPYCAKAPKCHAPYC